jgi:hypothetical protein
MDVLSTMLTAVPTKRQPLGSGLEFGVMCVTVDFHNANIMRPPWGAPPSPAKQVLHSCKNSAICCANRFIRRLLGPAARTMNVDEWEYAHRDLHRSLRITVTHWPHDLLKQRLQTGLQLDMRPS